MTEPDDFQKTHTDVAQRPVSEADDGVRLDRWFKIHYPAVPHGALEKMLRKGEVRVNGARAKANRRVETGEVIRVPPLPLDSGAATKKSVGSAGGGSASRAEDRDAIRVLTLYEDDALLVINKPFGLPVQGGAKTKRHIDGMLAALETKDGRPRLVHRLDRDTGGVLVLAKTRAAAAALGGAFQGREIEKTYWALAVKAPRPREGVIDLPVEKCFVGEADSEREQMVPTADGKRAVTDFQTIESSIGGPAFLALRPLTGRTHQLRVHCAAMETPIVGDAKYGGRDAFVEGVPRALHLFCREMRFSHPKTGKKLTIKAPLTGHMAETWRFFAFDQEAEVQWPEEVLARSRR